MEHIKSALARALRMRLREENPQRMIFDWLSEPRPINITPFQQHILDVDWDHSPVGPIHQWPAQLRHMVLMLVQDPDPAMVFWGDGNTMIYNEAHIQIIGNKHPTLQGQDPNSGLVEVWDYYHRLLEKQRKTAETVMEKDILLVLDRNDYLEETYISYKFSPLIGEEGWVVGSYCTATEVTRTILSDRRLAIVQELSLQLSAARSLKDIWGCIMVGLESAKSDIPHAFLYSVADTLASSKTTSRSLTPSNAGHPDSPIVCILEGRIRFPEKNLFAPATLDISTSEHCLAPSLQEARREKGPIVVPIKEDALQALEGIQYHEFNIPCTQMAVCPVIPMGSTEPLAFLIILLNPRKRYDADYKGFLNLLTKQVTTPQISAVIFREEVDRRQVMAREAALDRDQLSRKLSESESKFARFATRAPLGLAIISPTGQVLSANDLWRDLTQLDVGSQQEAWVDVLVNGELEPVVEGWTTVLNELQPVSLNTMVKRPWKAPEPDSEGNSQWDCTHLFLSLFPDFDEKGELCTVMSCITDITPVKWSESELRRKMHQAIDLKKQQESFIDMTSHEIRNPLSAVIGCADEILSSLHELRMKAKKSDMLTGGYLMDANSEITSGLRLLDDAIEAADTIIYCAMHQKRIIDDILTLSKLESNRLIVCPEPSRPIQLVRNALKMFEAELKRAETSLEFVEEESLEALQVQWTLLDPSRILQVIINLMTNAIKFTRTQKLRNIKITMGVSLIQPSAEGKKTDVRYVKKLQTNLDQTTNAEWGDGEIIYLYIKVQDTGKGLTEEEMKNLFHLFAQASPKTHQRYGGSGLGLFISRQLVEMQGGEIGVASEPGHGSTFQFYIKTRRTGPPTDSGKPDFEVSVHHVEVKEACAVETSSISNTELLIPKLSPGTPALKPNKLDILVVEDNLVNQKVVVKQLRKVGHVVSVANDGEEALDFITRSEYWNGLESGEKLSVVLMDLEMPVMDGLTCSRKIRELQRSGYIRGHLPIIAVTANARTEHVLACINAGMDDVTTKPYRMHDMLKQIDSLVARYPSWSSRSVFGH